MLGTELKKIINEIEVAEKTTLTGIAKKSGADRGTLSLSINKNKDNEVGANTLFKLDQAYPKYFKGVEPTKHTIPTPSTEEDVTRDALIKMLFEQVAKIHSKVFGVFLQDSVEEMNQNTRKAMKDILKNLKKKS